MKEEDEETLFSNPLTVMSSSSSHPSVNSLRPLNIQKIKKHSSSEPPDKSEHDGGQTNSHAGDLVSDQGGTPGLGDPHII